MSPPLPSTLALLLLIPILPILHTLAVPHNPLIPRSTSLSYQTVPPDQITFCTFHSVRLPDEDLVLYHGMFRLKLPEWGQASCEPAFTDAISDYCKKITFFGNGIDVNTRHETDAYCDIFFSGRDPYCVEQALKCLKPEGEERIGHFECVGSIFQKKKKKEERQGER